MKKFTEPEINVVDFEVVDVITTSGDPNIGDETPEEF